jgi:DNA-binding NarL/FixJ family response regulator
LQKIIVMKIVLYDNQQIILDGLNRHLSKIERIEMVGSATKKAAIVALLKSNEVDILIADITTDEALGLEFFEELQAMNLKTKVVVYSHYGSELIHHFLYEYGVVAIVNKGKGFAELWQVVEFAYLASSYKTNTTALPLARFREKKKNTQVFGNFGREMFRF